MSITIDDLKTIYKACDRNNDLVPVDLAAFEATCARPWSTRQTPQRLRSLFGSIGEANLPGLWRNLCCAIWLCGKKQRLAEALRLLEAAGAAVASRAEFQGRVIDAICRSFATPCAVKPFGEMIDPLQDNPKYGIPCHKPGDFKKLGVAFRGDDRTYDELKNVNGFMPAFADEVNIRTVGYPCFWTEGTILAKGICTSDSSSDILSGTAMCVTRHFFGGARFSSGKLRPEKGIQTRGYVYAVQVWEGFDTEAHQKTIQDAAEAAARGHADGEPKEVKGVLWRSGEKVTHKIEIKDILASVPVRAEINEGVGGYFEVLADEWTWHNEPDDWERTDYIVEAIRDLRGKVNKYDWNQYDFPRS